jgi:transcriptional regulator GlxA family with amidase domain
MIRAGVKIEAVALFVGYRSKKNFYRRFRRHFATTPLQFRLDAARRRAG